jgi:hypothetical protein
MLLKFIVGIWAKPHADPSNNFRELAMSKGTGEIEFSSKTDDNGHYWITRITATLLHDEDILHEPCIVRVDLMDCHYMIGTADLPVFPVVKEGVLTDMTIEYKSKTKPVAI